MRHLTSVDLPAGDAITGLAMADFRVNWRKFNTKPTYLALFNNQFKFFLARNENVLKTSLNNPRCVHFDAGVAQVGLNLLYLQ